MVLDASVVTAALVDSGPSGTWAIDLISAAPPLAPQLVLVEVTNALRRLELARAISSAEANAAQRDLMRLDIELYPYAPLSTRVWQLRANLTSYDANYVALAEALSVPLATLDLKLTRAAGARCDFVTP